MSIAAEACSGRQPKIGSAAIIDPGLGTWTGHWGPFNRRVADGLRLRGIAVTIYGHRNVNDAISGTLPVVGHFSRAPWESADADPERNHAQLATEFATEMSGAALDGSADQGSLLIFPTITPSILDGVVSWINSRANLQRRDIAILFQFGEGTDVLELGGESSAVPLYRKSIRGLREAAERHNLRLFASSTDLAARFRTITRMPVRSLCMPADFRGTDLRQRASSTSEITVGYFGHCSLEKGGQFLFDLVRFIRTHRPNSRFLLHLNPNIWTVGHLEKFDEPLEGVTCLRGHLSQSQLENAIASVDIALMPYDPRKYKNIPSAVLCEMLLASKVVVSTEGTWVARELRRVDAGATYAAEYRLGSLCDALAVAIDNLPVLLAKAQTAARRWKLHHSVESFVDGLLHPFLCNGLVKQSFGWQDGSWKSLGL